MFPKLVNNNVPIIGQPFTLKTWAATAVIVCNCAAKEPVLLTGNGIGQCPACQQAYQIHQLVIANGQVNFQIGMLARADEKPGS